MAAKRTKIVAITMVFAFFLFSLIGTAHGAINYSFTGGGHGHGVGISMSGVSRLAKAGRDYPTILKYYYRGISVGRQAGLPRYIRAAVYSTRGTLSFSGNNQFKIYDSDSIFLKIVNSGEILKVKFRNNRYYISVIRSGRTVWSKVWAAPITIKHWHASALRLYNNGRQYKGDFFAKSTGSNSIWAINRLGLETYLKGLGEEPESWPIKGLRTLAVTSRTYAVEKILRKKTHYDISQNQQFYVGIRKAPRLAYAVNSTRKVIATYKGKPILAAYSANSGGYEADFRTIWGGNGYPYLRARKDRFSSKAKNYRWGPVIFSSGRLRSIFGQHGINIGSLRAIHFGHRGADRRPRKVTLVGSRGRKTIWAYSQFASWLGLKSSLMWVKKINTRRISINASAKSLRPKQPLMVYGRIRPSTKGTLVLRYKRGRLKWRTLKKIKVNRSIYRVKLRLSMAARYVFSVRLGSTSSRNMVINARGKPVVVRRKIRNLSFRRSYTLSINASKKKVRPRQQISIYGKVNPPASMVVLKYKKGHSRWRTLRKITAFGSRYRTNVRVNSANSYVFSVKVGSSVSRNMVIYSRGKPINISTLKKSDSSALLIVIDPGHGGRDKGARGPNGIREKNVNLKVALKLKGYLQAAGARVVMTRDRDRTLSLKARVSIAKRVRANRYVSIHHNSSSRRSVNGTETYLKRRGSRTSLNLARKIQRSLLNNLGLANRHVRRANFYVLKNSRIPAVLSEASFISNRAEARRLCSSAYIAKEAQAIFYGLKSHMSFGRLYAPLAIQGASTPASEINFPFVVDTSNYWRSFVSIKNTSAINQVAEVSLYNADGTLLKTTSLNLNPNQTHSFYPKVLLGNDFSGSIKVSATPECLVGQLSQISKDRKSLANVQALVGATNLYIPDVVDNDKWSSFIALKNVSSNSGVVNVNYYNADGSLLKTDSVTLGSQANYNFYPKDSTGSDFNGSLEINSNMAIAGYTNRLNSKNARLGIAPAIKSSTQQNFAQAPEDAAFRSYLTILNTNSLAQDVSISAFKADGSLLAQKTINIAGKAIYKTRVLSVVGGNFNGAIKISSSLDGLAAYLLQTDKHAKALGLMEGQQGSQSVNFAYLNDGGTMYSTEVAIAGSDSVEPSLNLFDTVGSLLSTTNIAINENGCYRFYPWTVLNKKFNGSINTSAVPSQVVGYLAQSR